MKKAIVSVLLGGYDQPRKAPKFYGWDSILFTDLDIDEKLGWKVIRVSKKDKLKGSRYYKWMTHKTLPSYDLICYMDASMVMMKEPPLTETWFRHPVRKNLKDEGKQILLYYPELESVIEKQLGYFKSKGFNDDYGVYQNGFFVRYHNNETNAICKAVYDVVRKYCHRDQLALPYALYITNNNLNNVLNGNIMSRWVIVNRHL